MAARGLLLDGRYRLDDRIGAGGMGEVWRASDLLLKRPVAAKLLRPGHGQQEDEVARFRAEARQAASLSDPGIAQVYDYCETSPAQPPYLVMELVDGPSLAELLDQGPMDPARAMSVIAQVAAGLQAAHSAGLVHRDIKPANLLVSKSGQVKITDFGIARAVGSTLLTRTGVLIGSPAYMAPERAVGAPATPACDLYSLGIVAYQCLTGVLPFHGDPLAVALAHQEQPLPPLPPSVPAEVAGLVAELAAKDPRRRPASARQVAERAEQLHAALSRPAGSRVGPAEAGVGGQIPSLAGPPAPRQAKQAPAAGPARQHRRRARRITAGHGVRFAFALGGIAAIGLAGWMMAGLSGSIPQHARSGPPSASQPAHPRRIAAGPSNRSHHASTHGPVLRAASPAQGPDRNGLPRSFRPATAPSSPVANVAPKPSPTTAPTPRPSPTDTPSPSSSPTDTPSPSLSPTDTPSPSPSPTDTPSPSLSPTDTPSPSPSPADTPTVGPSSGLASTPSAIATDDSHFGGVDVSWCLAPSASVAVRGM